MTAFYRPPLPLSPLASRLDVIQRKPQRITVTVNWNLHHLLHMRAATEGRSLSNLVAHLLESSLL